MEVLAQALITTMSAPRLDPRPVTRRKFDIRTHAVEMERWYASVFPSSRHHDASLLDPHEPAGFLTVPEASIVERLQLEARLH